MIWRAVLIWLLSLAPAMAQDFSGLAKIDTARSSVSDARGALVIDLHLSQPVPYRVFTLDDPRRVVLDFREVDWTGASREALLNSDLATAVHFGPLRPGWSRLVADLGQALIVTEAGMQVAPDTGAAHLTVRLAPTDPQSFAAKAGAPTQSAWDALLSAPTPEPADPNGPLVIAIDPGHGGIDPGAERGGVTESELMMTLGVELADVLNRTGQIKAVLTRDANYFVSLEARMTAARTAGASALISLHADALEIGSARGASVYTLNDQAQGTASARMAERHERGDLVAGLDLNGQSDRVAGVLMDLARLETGPASDRLADALLTGMSGAGVNLHPRPRREGRLAVLNAPDFASVLIEAGFLSDPQDRAMLQDPVARQKLVRGIADGVIAWAIAEEVNAPLVRQ